MRGYLQVGTGEAGVRTIPPHPVRKLDEDFPSRRDDSALDGKLREKLRWGSSDIMLLASLERPAYLSFGQDGGSHLSVWIRLVSCLSGWLMESTLERARSYMLLLTANDIPPS